MAAPDGILKRQRSPYTLVGAAVRDILVYNNFGQRVLRAMQDGLVPWCGCRNIIKIDVLG